MPGFAAELLKCNLKEEVLNKVPINTLWKQLVADPLHLVQPMEELPRRVLLLDALDESERGGDNDLLTILAK